MSSPAPTKTPTSVNERVVKHTPVALILLLLAQSCGAEFPACRDNSPARVPPVTLAILPNVVECPRLRGRTSHKRRPVQVPEIHRGHFELVLKRFPSLRLYKLGILGRQRNQPHEYGRR